MSRNPIAVIALKEVRDTLRDRRTVLAMIILPLVLIPFFVIGFPILIQTVMTGETISASPVAIVGAENAPGLFALLESSELFDVVETENATQALRDGDVSVVLRIPEHFEQDIASEKPTSLVIEYISSDTSSQIAEGKLRSIIEAYRDSIVTERLEQLGVDEGILTPFATDTLDASTPQEQSGYWLGFIIPMFLAIWAANGGMYTAIDVTAGEKERGSLEALLSTPPGKTQIILGKFIAVVGMAMLSVILALVALMASLYLGGGTVMFGPGAGGVAAQVGAEAYLLILLVCLLLSSMVGALEIAICIFAKSFKEAQNYVTPLTFVIIFPAILTQFFSVYDMTPEVFAVPVLNTVFVIKEVLVGIVNPVHIGITVVTTLAYALFCILVAVKLFRREDVLFR